MESFEDMHRLLSQLDVENEDVVEANVEEALRTGEWVRVQENQSSSPTTTTTTATTTDVVDDIQYLNTVSREVARSKAALSQIFTASKLIGEALREGIWVRKEDVVPSPVASSGTAIDKYYLNPQTKERIRSTDELAHRLMAAKSISTQREVHLQALEAMASRRLTDYVIALVLFCRDTDQNFDVRSKAIDLLRTTVVIPAAAIPRGSELDKRKEQLTVRWKETSIASRTYLKEEILSTLASAEPAVREISAQLIATFATMELPENAWPELLRTLFQAASGDSEDAIDAAILTLSCVAQSNLHTPAIAEVLLGVGDCLLEVLMKAMVHSSSDVHLNAMNALYYSLESMHGHMEEQPQRDYLIGVVATAAGSGSTTLVREKAMSCLVKIAFLYYGKLKRYKTDLISLTTNCISDRVHARSSSDADEGHVVGDPDDAVALEALQFWSTICLTEKELRDGNGFTATSSGGSPGGGQSKSTLLGFASSAVSQIAPLLTKGMTTQPEHPPERGEVTLSSACSKCLLLLCQAVGDPVVAAIEPFVNKYIEASPWRHREAACMAFGCMLHGPDPQSLTGYVERFVAQALLEYSGDPHPLLADTASWCVAVICDRFVDVFLGNAELMQRLLNTVNPMFRRETARALRAAQIVHNLSLQFEDEDYAEGDDDTTGIDDDDNGTFGASSIRGGPGRTKSRDSSQTFGHSTSGPYGSGTSGSHGHSNELFTLNYHIFVDLLLQNTRREGGELRTETQEALNALIGAAQRDNKSLQTLSDLLVELLQETDDHCKLIEQSSTRNAEWLGFIALLCRGIARIIRKLGPSFGGIRTPLRILDQLLRVLAISTPTVAIEALQAIGALSATTGAHLFDASARLAASSLAAPDTSALSSRSKPLTTGGSATDRLCDVLIDSLRAQPTQCLAAVTAIVDIVAGMREEFASHQEFMNPIIEELMLNLKTDVVAVEVKSAVIGALGDIVQYSGPKFSSKIGTVMEVLHGPAEKEAQNLIQQAMSSKDRRKRELANDLHESICHCFTGIVTGFRGQLHLLDPYVKRILQLACHVAAHPASNEEAIRSSISLIGIFAYAIGQEDANCRRKWKHEFQLQMVKDVLSSGAKSHSEVVREASRFTLDEIHHVTTM